MAIHQTKQQSDLEKRLKILRQQLHGKGRESENPVRSNLTVSGQKVGKSESQTFRYADRPTLSGTPSHSKLFRSDAAYLSQDLLKISLLASIALGTQIILFYLLKNNVLRTNLL